MNKATDCMTRLKRFINSLDIPKGRIYAGRIYASLLMLMAMRLMGQDIYDASHSREFAQHLMQTHQFQLAASEWERVLFLNSTDTLARLNQIKSLRLAGKPTEAWQKLNHWYPGGSLSRPFSTEALQLTLIQEKYSSLLSVIERSNELSLPEKSNYQLANWMMEGSWINQPVKFRAPPFAVTANHPRLLDIYGKAVSMHRKSPGAAVALSAILPGMGKVYSNDWKDGLLSLLFVATSAWQSYRGFSKNGTTSVTGWVFGSMAIGFYSANLFGSWKSAKNYNLQQTDRIRHETEGVIFSY